MMTLKNKWIVGVGVALLLALMFALPFLWKTLMPYEYGMMGMRGGMMGAHSGMMTYGYGFGLMWVIPVAVLILIGLGIAALVKYLNTPNAETAQEN